MCHPGFLRGQYWFIRRRGQEPIQLDCFIYGSFKNPMFERMFEPLPPVLLEDPMLISSIFVHDVASRRHIGGSDFMSPRERRSLREFPTIRYMTNPHCPILVFTDSRRIPERTQGDPYRLGNPASADPFVVDYSFKPDPEAALDALVGDRGERFYKPHQGS